MIKKLLLIAVASILSTISLSAQYSVSGYVKDGETEEIISNVSVVLTLPSSVIYAGGETDSLGVFKITNVKSGKYLLYASVLGYENSILEVEVEQDVELDTILLKRTSMQIDEIVVKADAVNHMGDRVVINLSAYMVTAGRSSFDVLPLLPGVQRGRDDALSIANQEVTVFINGRKHHMTKQAFNGYLRSIPADRIATIEIYESPPAKFNTSTPVIDIRLKRDGSTGFNGNVGGSTTYRDDWSYDGDLNLNYRTKKTNIFGGGFYSVHKEDYKSNSTRKYADASPAIMHEAKSESSFSNESPFAYIGMDYFISEKHTLGIFANARIKYNDIRKAHELTKIQDIDQLSTLYLTENWHYNKGENKENITFNLNYEWAIDERNSTLSTDFSYYRDIEINRKEDSTIFLDTNSNEIAPEDSYIEYNRAPVDFFVGKVDFNKYFKKGWQILSGASLTSVKREAEYKYDIWDGANWSEDLTKSNQFAYDEQVASWYIGGAKNDDKYYVGASLTTAYTDLRGVQEETGGRNSRSYFSFLPRIVSTWKIAKSHYLTLNYYRGISRPHFSYLDPFEHRSGVYYITRGNPLLNPSYSNNLTLSYVYKTFSLSAYYRHSKDLAVQERSQDDATGITYLEYANMGKSQQYGAYAYKTFQPTPWFTIRGYAMLYGKTDDTKYLGDDFHKTSLQYYADVVLSFIPTKNMDIEVFANYTSDNYTMATKTPWRVYSYLKIGHHLFKKRGYISFKVDNPISSLVRSGSTTRYKNIDYKTSIKEGIRAFSLSFNYNFGSDKIKGKRDRQTGVEETKGRM